MNSYKLFPSPQQGGALLIFMLVLVLAALTTLLGLLDGSDVKIERTKINAHILSRAKTALVGHSVGVNGSQSPGILIAPDSFGSTESPYNYDGSSDFGCLNFSVASGLPLITNRNINMRCLGRLPWKDLGLSIHGASEEDASGIMPWYAVSANLVDIACLGLLNPNTLNLTHIPPPSPINCTGTGLPYPWLTVRDGSGNVVSNRVAAIIFIPNEARGGQVRSSSPLGAANQYLDTLTIPAGCAAPCVPGTYSNADMDNDYIFSSEGNPVAADSHFNDQLVYITVDELMAAVEKRVAGEVRSQLLAYKALNATFPDAATIGYQGQSCVQGQNAGFLPLPILSCTGSVCDGAFPAAMQFNSDVNYSARTGACSYLANVCTCTGQGSCSRATPRRLFGCSSTGTCKSNITGTFSYSPLAPIDASSMQVTGGACAVAGSTANCTNAGQVTVNGASNQCAISMAASTFPDWFAENGWKHFIYYAKGSLNIGSSTASSAIVTTGARLNTQLRPSGLLADYLDSIENTNGDNSHDAIGTPRTNAYNDQMFIVSP